MKDSFNETLLKVFDPDSLPSANKTLLSNVAGDLGENNFHAITSFCRIIFVFLLRAGYLLIQLGSIPTENVYIILLQNIVDMAVGLTGFGLLGYTIAFGKDILYGLFGFGTWIVASEEDMNAAVLGVTAVLTSTSIITTILSGRLHFVGYLFTTIIFSGLLQPVVMHWFWQIDGVFRKDKFFGQSVIVRDYGGASVIHLTAGTGSLVASLFLGRRLLKLYDIDESSVGTESPGTTIVGYFFLIIGYVAFMLPSPILKADDNGHYDVNITVVNCLMAIAGSVLMVVLLSFIFSRKKFHYWIILRCMQSSIVGLVSIAPGVNIYLPITCFGISVVGGVIFCGFSRCFYWTSIEDYCNIIPTHFICAIYGLLIVPILWQLQVNGLKINPKQLLTQSLCHMISSSLVVGFIMLSFAIICLLLLISGFLRNRNENINHMRSLNVLKRRDVGPLQRMFKLHKDTPYLEPGPSGKNPDDIGPRRSQTFERKDRSIHFFKSRDKFDASRSEQYKDEEEKPNGFNEKDSDKSAVSNKRHTTTIFTMQNPTPELHAVFRSGTENVKCAGDSQTNVDSKVNSWIMNHFDKLKQDEVIKVPFFNKLKKVNSGITLHRTKKFTNLLGSLNKSKLLPIDSGNVKIYLPTDIDKKLNDGFTVIKMPPNNKE